MNMKKIKILGILISALLSAKVFAFGMMEVEDWQFQFSGNVNAFVVSTDCDANNNGAVSGGLACGSNGNSDNATNVRTGLLPSWFGFHATRNKGGSKDFKTGITLGFQPGADDGVGGGALGNNTVNFRQVFFDIGRDDFGTIKIGRDLGLFGGDAILSDMTLLGVGTVSDLTKNGGNTSLGRIGVGYIYADWKAQLQYTSPTKNGFSFSLALVDPWKVGALAGDLSFAASDQKRDTFGYEGKVNYATDNMKLWAGFISQDVEDNARVATDTVIATPGNVGKAAVTARDAVDYTASGYDVGVKFNTGGFELMGYYYQGEGIGTTGFLLDGADPLGNKRDSDGYIVQITKKINKTKYGISYGESNLDLSGSVVAGADGLAANSSLVKTNESVVVGVYHSLNDALTLTAEYTNTESEAHDDATAEEESFAVGGIMFF